MAQGTGAEISNFAISQYVFQLSLVNLSDNVLT